MPPREEGRANLSADGLAQGPKEDKNDSDRGAALIEFAMVAPLLIMLALGVVQLGLILNRQQGLHAAAREGARAASLPDSSNEEINAAVQAALVGVAGATPIDVVVYPNSAFPCADRSGQSVTVEVQTVSELDIPFLAGRQVDIEGRGVFRCE